MLRAILTAVAYVVSLAVLAPVVFFVVMFLAGPHSSILPTSMQPAVVVIGLITLVVAPFAIARLVWRRAARRPAS